MTPSSATSRAPGLRPARIHASLRALGPSERAATGGFTLIEILLVVFLIGVATAVFAPRIGSKLKASVRTGAEVLTAQLRLVAEQAVATGETHRLLLDLERQRFRMERLALADAPPPRRLATNANLLDLTPPSRTREFVPVDTSQGDWQRLDEDDVVIAAIRLGEVEVTRDAGSVAFAPDGSADPAEITLVDAEGRVAKIQVLAFTGEVQTVEQRDDE
jgi:type II secretion system protein H